MTRVCCLSRLVLHQVAQVPRATARMDQATLHQFKVTVMKLWKLERMKCQRVFSETKKKTKKLTKAVNQLQVLRGVRIHRMKKRVNSRLELRRDVLADS